MLGIYSGAGAYMYDERGNLTWCFDFLSGVLQGCPASAFLFNLALDPFLPKFQSIFTEHGRGLMRACADDLGTALRALKQLTLLFPIFRDAQTLAGLMLNPPSASFSLSSPSPHKFAVALNPG